MSRVPPFAVLVFARPELPLVAEVPAFLRGASAAAEAGAGRIVAALPAEDVLARWRGVCRRLPGFAGVAADRGADPLAGISPDEPVLVLSPDGYPEARDLARFLAEAGSRDAVWVWRGRRVAAFFEDGRALRAASEPLRPEPDAARIEAPDGAWHAAATPAEARGSEEVLFGSLRKQTDGYLARLDRTISIALSRRLLSTRVTPNQITTAGLIVGLAGAALLASASHAWSLFGALILWTGCILDGSDGEVARLKLLCSRAGGRYDVLADNLVHAAIFVAIPIHVHRVRPDLRLAAPAALLLSGVALSALSVWYFVARPEAPRVAPGAARFVERLASRDFIYIVLALAVLRRLEWFLFAAAAGAHIFWIALAAAARRGAARGGETSG
jgi:phosphatidylglycerophosphate synthase